MKARLIILIVLLVGWGAIILLLSGLLPDYLGLPVARVTPTPTRTPKATFTMTATPTRTLTPSPTATPTQTPTATLVPTNTPPPTATPTIPATSTDTPTSLPSSTPRASNSPTAPSPPTPRPSPVPANTRPPQPTATPAPPFAGRILRGYTNCGGYRGVTGEVKHANGAAYDQVAVGVWSEAWDGKVSVSEPNGKFELTLTDVPPGRFMVAVVRLETCSQQDGRPTAKNCTKLSNVIDNVTTTQECEGAGANQVTEIEFVGP